MMNSEIILKKKRIENFKLNLTVTICLFVSDMLACTSVAALNPKIMNCSHSRSSTATWSYSTNTSEALVPIVLSYVILSLNEGRKDRTEI